MTKIDARHPYSSQRSFSSTYFRTSEICTVVRLYSVIKMLARYPFLAMAFFYAISKKEALSPAIKNNNNFSSVEITLKGKFHVAYKHLEPLPSRDWQYRD